MTSIPDDSSAATRARLTSLQQAVRSAPKDAGALNALATLYGQLGRKREAADLFLKTGVAFYEQKNPRAALVAWRKAVSLMPGMVLAHLNIGKVMREQGGTATAISAFETAVRLDPSCLPAWRSLSALYFTQGRLDDCERACRRRLELVPNDPAALAGLGQVLERKADIAGAYAALKPLVAAGTEDPDALNTFAQVCRHLSPPRDEAVQALKHRLDGPGLKPNQRRTLLKSLAELCDALGEHAEAFAFLQESKKLRSPEDPQGRRAKVQALILRIPEFYTPERLARIPGATHGSGVPIFIIGMPRSGTTLAEQILSSHPAVHGAGELRHIAKIAAEILPGAEGYPACLESLTPARVDELANLYLAKVRPLALGAAHVTDKMPFNFFHLGLIRVLFPRAPVIHCVRHPLDTCVSIYFNEINNMTDDRDLAELGRYYRYYWTLMQQWRQILRPPLFELRYETLLAEPERVTRELIAFCGLEWDDACLRFHESKRFVATLSYHQVRQPLYRHSIGRYKVYEPFLGPLKDAIGEDILSAWA